MAAEREVWFHKYRSLSVDRYWPCHWKGWLTLVLCSILAFGLWVAVIWVFDKYGHKELDWLGLIGFLVGMIRLRSFTVGIHRQSFTDDRPDVPTLRYDP